jgi:hypothetical protein
MRDELDRALDNNPDYPPGFDPRWLEDEIDAPVPEEIDPLLAAARRAELGPAGRR